jgi:hypothetical protein
MYVMVNFIGIGIVFLVVDSNPLLAYHAWGLWFLALIVDTFIFWGKRHA